jgi:LysM repeat protein
MADSLQAGASLTTGQSLTSANGDYTLTLQGDGNLVLSEGGKAVWATGTNGKGAARLKVQEDGNAVLYTQDNAPVWASQTAGKGGDKLVVQDDRNVVLYAGGTSVWSTGTAVAAAPAEAPVETPVEAPAEAPAPAAPQTYTVQGGDTLWVIAERFYGDGNQYPRIAQASGVSNPDLINVGQVLTIPA